MFHVCAALPTTQGVCGTAALGLITWRKEVYPRESPWTEGAKDAHLGLTASAVASSFGMRTTLRPASHGSNISNQGHAEDRLRDTIRQPEGVQGSGPVGPPGANRWEGPRCLLVRHAS